MELLIILISVLQTLLIVKLMRRTPKVIETTRLVKDTRAIGVAEKALIKAKIAEAMGGRAFNLASTANLGVIALQKTLSIPRMVNREQATKNQYAKAEVDKLFTTNGGFDFLKPILGDEELEFLEKMEQDNLKNGSPS